MRRNATANARAYLALGALAMLGCGPTAPATGPTGPKPVPPSEVRSDADAAPRIGPGEPSAEEVAGLGRSNAEAIEVCKPSGQTAYLSRLRCADGNAPSYQRVGHSGYRTARAGPDDYKASADQVRTGRPLEEGEKDFHPIDMYTVVCRDAEVVHKLYLDMHHCSESETTSDPPKGFTVFQPPPPPAPAVPATQPTGG